MSDLQIHLLGTFQIWQNGRSLTTFRTNKIRALLAYLAVEADHPHRRDSLAALFWPEMDNRSALTNLRLSLHRLRQALGNDPPVLRIDRYTVQWCASAARIDAIEFEQALTAVTAHDHAPLCPDCARRLETAVPHYKGDFLAGFFLEDAAPFDDWAAARRERLHQQALQALAWLADYHQENGRYPQAILHTRRQLELEPWREPAHRQMMQLLAATGQHAAALRQYEQCRRLLRDELGAAPEAATTDLHRQIQAERTATSPHRKSESQPVPLSPAQRITANLPATAAPLVGRQAELAQLDQLMSHPATRLVTITGVGGMGKTRLALTWCAAQAAHQPQHFPHGIYFVPLTAVHTAAYLVPAIAQTLPFTPDAASTQPLPQQLDDYLCDRQLLLVLDNFEQLLTGEDGAAATAVLHHLLNHAPQLKLLVTSREHLHLQNEQPLPLNGLPCPGDQETEWAQFPAAQLFEQSARRVQPDFALTTPDRPHLIAICRLLDGIPLALELAAAWVEWLPLADIAAEIGRSLDFLAADRRDWPERHRSMRAIFDSAWARLSRPEQAFFARLSPFCGGFTRAAALAVAGEAQPRPTVLRLLASLVQKSLLRYERLAERYTMHELLRQYGAGKLAQDTALSGVHQAYAVYYCRWLNQQEPVLKGENQKEALNRIQADLENIRAAWQWAIQTGMLSLLAEAAFGLGLFLLRNGRFPEGTVFFGDAVRQFQTETATQDEYLALARLHYWRAVFEPSLPRRREMLEQGLALLPTTADENRTRAVKAAILLELGSLARSQGRHEVVEELLRQSLTLYRLSDDRWGEANVLYELGVRTWRQGEYPSSEQWFNHCLRLRQSLGDGNGTAVALEGLAGTALFSGRAEEAHRLLQQSAPLYRELDDQVGVARLKIKQAQVSWYLDLTGLVQFAEGLDSLRTLGERRLVALWTVIYAMLQADEDINLAAQNAAEGLNQCRELGLQRGAAIAQGVLSRVALVDGRYAAAQELAELYLQTAQTLTLSVEYVDALVWAGWGALACGDEARAGWCAAQALQIPNYWRVACLDLTAVLLARRSADNYKWAWQILGYGEDRYARLRSPISQEILMRFLPQAMQQMPPGLIRHCKKQRRGLDGTAVWSQVQAALA